MMRARFVISSIDYYAYIARVNRFNSHYYIVFIGIFNWLVNLRSGVKNVFSQIDV